MGGGISSTGGGSSSTGETVPICGCYDPRGGFALEFCEDVRPPCERVRLDCGSEQLNEPDVCLAAAILEPDAVAALDCQLASIQAEDPGEAYIELSWMNGFARAYRQLLIDSAQQATAFENNYGDIPPPPMVTVGGNPAIEAAACAQIEDATDRLGCAWAMYRLEAPLVCD